MPVDFGTEFATLLKRRQKSRLLLLPLSQLWLGQDMLYSKGCQYAIRCICFLAREEEGRPIPLKEVAHKTQIPLPFLAKIATRLKKNQLLRARRGVRGGILLNRLPTQITIQDIVEAIDGEGIYGRCILGFSECSDFYPCPVHECWLYVRDVLQKTLYQRTVADLVRSLAAVQSVRGR